MLIEPWRIEMFGGLRARQRDRTVDRFRTRQVAGLLAYLAHHSNKAASRDELSEMLWPETDPERQRQNLRQALFYLRRHLESAGPSSRSIILSDFAGVRFCAGAVLTDVSEFQRLVEAESNGSDQIARLRCAVDLYSGPLLPHLDDPWIEPERQRLRDVYLGALKRLIRSLAESKELDLAIEYAHRALREDPYREDAHRALMRLYLAVGRPSAAREQFAELAQLLSELDEMPSAETRELASRIPESVSPHLPSAVLKSPTTESVESPALERSESIRKPALPRPLTRLFGRAEECESIVRALEKESRLITLTGPGGIGKTRLAVEVAHAMSAGLGGAAYFVPLADLRDPAAIPDRILSALPIERSANRAPMEQVVGHLSDRPGLLVLDNLEQIMPGARAAILALRSAAPDLRILATSRVRIRGAGEVEHKVALLTIPGNSEDAVEEAASVKLFVDRAQTARSEFRLTEHNRETVAAICRRLEGLPLAIELAAARIGTLTPAQILTGLEERFRILSTVHADKSDRHRSLWATIEWSYDLLPADLQRFFAHLTVFRGGWTAETAAEVASDTAKDDGNPVERERTTLDMLERLRSHSLIEDEECLGQLRYRMLETIREFARSQLDAFDESSARERHLCAFIRIGEQYYANRFSPQAAVFQSVLTPEQDNFRSALAFGLEHDPDAAVRLAGSAGLLWYFRGNVQEAEAWLDQALNCAEKTVSSERARAANLAGLMALDQCKLPTARAFFEDSLACRPADSEPWSVAGTLHNLAQVECGQGNYARAEELFQRAVEMAGKADERAELGLLLSSYGLLYYSTGDLDRAESLCRKGLEVLTRRNDRWATGNVLLSLGLIALERKDFDRADFLCHDALAIHGELESARGIALAHHYLGLSALKRGRLEEASRLLREALSEYGSIGDKNGAAEALEGMAELFLRQGRPTLAATLLASARQIRESIGAPISAVSKAEYSLLLAETQREAGALFDRSWKEGTALSPDGAASLAIAESVD